jgi:protein-tyrosine kinase
MERIQAAISKARTSRQDQHQGAVIAHARQVEALAAAPDLSHAAAWEALPAFTPDAKHLERNRIVSYPGGAAAGPYDLMRTKVLQAVKENGWRRIAITSPGAACGKTMTTLNLAFSLARLRDVRTVVIEADLRRPSMARVLGDQSGHLFAEVLAGRAPASEHMVRFGANLAFGTNRGATANAAELLHGPEFAEALDRIEALYQPTVMLFDMAPMLMTDDTIASIGSMDAVLLVAAAEHSTVPEVDRCEQDLAARSNVMGVVLNKCRYLDKSEGYGGKYGY